MITSEINFDLLLCLTWIGTNIDSIESKICPKGLSEDFEHQDRHWRFQGFKEVFTQ